MYGEDEVPVRENSPDEEKSRAFLAKYYGLVTAVDDVVGRVMDYLDEKGLSDNTIVYFVSDHGEMAGEHGLGVAADRRSADRLHRFRRQLDPLVALCRPGFGRGRGRPDGLGR